MKQAQIIKAEAVIESDIASFQCELLHNTAIQDDNHKIV